MSHGGAVNVDLPRSCYDRRHGDRRDGPGSGRVRRRSARRTDLALLDPDLVPGPFFVATIVLTFASAGREWHGIDWSVVRWATVGRVPGPSSARWCSPR
ncbi:MAG: hypothetical protein R2695_09070 [Acidimicrobiales bacterium]